MDKYIPTREEALQLLKEYNPDDSLIKHALAVEGVMRYMARKNGEDEEKWDNWILVHDIDYFKYPEQTLPEEQGDIGRGRLAGRVYTVL